MRRCFTDPHYWKNPALRRSREKAQIVLDTVVLNSTTIHLLSCTTLHPRKYRQDMSLDTLIDFVAEAVPTGIQMSGRTFTKSGFL